uniref:Single-strand-selective monofunctional uracil-DNA glycosylase 1 n=1 Tax=Buteo japonicus TaxID=224669 RepID=A0A8C0AYS6_9AVES
MEESAAETVGTAAEPVTGTVPVAEEEEEEDDNDDDLAGRFLRLEREQSALLQALPPFGDPVSHVYHPLDYAWEPHCDFVRRYCRTPKRTEAAGSTPGPFHFPLTSLPISQVPFGEVWHVREWLRVVGGVKKPPSEHPKRPVLGLTCRRAEVSGGWEYTSVWGCNQMWGCRWGTHLDLGVQGGGTPWWFGGAGWGYNPS